MTAQSEVRLNLRSPFERVYMDIDPVYESALAFRIIQIRRCLVTRSLEILDATSPIRRKEQA
jgi:hypothetical protein